MEYIRHEMKDEIAFLTIDRPKALNALNVQVLEELRQYLTFARDYRGLILTGAGEKAFISGADIAAMHAMSQKEINDFAILGQEVTRLLENTPYPTIAAVNGYALGGGLEVALSCDFIYASKNAKLGLPEVTLGVIPGFGGTQRLARAIGVRRTKEMIYTGKAISAEEAATFGIVNKVVEADKLLDAAFTTAFRMARYSEVALRQAKDAINHGVEAPLADALVMERNQFVVAFATPEREKAMAKFLEKMKR